jgi:hypothetical protein
VEGADGFGEALFDAHAAGVVGFPPEAGHLG